MLMANNVIASKTVNVMPTEAKGMRMVLSNAISEVANRLNRSR
jgi:hypothetical protein